MNPPLIYWNTPQDVRPVLVRISRAMILKPLGCSPRPVSIGEEIVISDATLRQLGSHDIEVLGYPPEASSFDI